MHPRTARLSLASPPHIPGHTPSRVLVPVWPLSPRVLIPASLSPFIPHPRSPHPAYPVPRPGPTHRTPRPCPCTPCPVSRSPRLHALSVHVPPAPHCRRAACVQILGQPGTTTLNPGRRLTASSPRVHAPLLVFSNDQCLLDTGLSSCGILGVTTPASKKLRPDGRNRARFHKELQSQQKFT